MSNAQTPEQTPGIKAGAEPFEADGGRLGVLLCHGFTGSPASMKPWAEYLANEGFTVSVPRLPGHGTTWQEMNTTTWRDWYGEVDAALTRLQSKCDWVAVCGLSMGGALALRLAAYRPEDVGALVLVNPAIALKRLDLKFVPAMSKVIGSLPGIGNDIAMPGKDEIGYDRTPLKALASQLQMWSDVRKRLGQIDTPMLMFRSNQDHVVDETSSKLLMSSLGSAHRELIELTDSFHVATLDYEAEFIMERSAEFIRTQAPKTAS
ncbi:MAG TPA: alpha/beta fold hydrolase [Aeromicrobium sp.]|nr:alpha/beta fold hydrolase [Aeromicrobium sp.]